MARFCSKCGAPLKPGQRFCKQCGTPAAPEGEGMAQAGPDTGRRQAGPGAGGRQAANNACQMPAGPNAGQRQPGIAQPYGGQAASGGNTRSVLIGLLVGVVVLLAGGLGYSALHGSKAPANTAATQTEAPSSGAGNAPAAPAAPQAPPSKEQENTQVVATYFVVNCKKSITLRTAPSTSAPEIAQIPLGMPVGYIENASNGFSKINYDGRTGYALSAYLSQNRPAQTITETNARVVNCDSWVTLRRTPSTSAAELDRIPLGDEVFCYGDAGNGFYTIAYKGRIGYVLKNYIARF